MRGRVDEFELWITRSDRTAYGFWLGLSLAVAAFGGVIALTEAFAAPYVVQDDVRQHVVWALRFVDPDLFPVDAVADYFRSVAPVGYGWVYRGAAALGVDPLVLAKILPLPLGLVFAAYGFALGCRIVPVPAAGFLISWTLTENAWLMDNLASATPRAFLYPIFAAFLYHLLRRSGWGVAVTVLLLGLFYPQMALVAAGLSALVIVEFRRGWPRLARDLARGGVAAFGVAAAIVVLAPYALLSAAYGPVIAPLMALELPEFWVGQRAAFYDPDLWRFWSCGERSGLFPIEWCQLKDDSIYGLPATIAPFAVLVVVVALPVYLRRRGPGPVTGYLGEGIYVVPRLLLVSVVLFAAAHVLLFQLHLPNRYSQHSIRFAFDLAFGACVYLLLLKAVVWMKARPWSSRLGGMVAAGLVAAMVVTIPIISTFVGDRLYVAGRYPSLYGFLQTTPKDTIVASLVEEGNNLPAFSRRSLLFGQEFAIPYHLGYYTPYRERGRRLVEAQYTPNPGVLRRFMRDFDVDYWLLDTRAFEADQIDSAWWSRQYPAAHEAVLHDSESGAAPVLASLAPLCAVLRDASLLLVDAACLSDGVRR